MGDLPIISQPTLSVGEFEQLLKLALMNKENPFFHSLSKEKSGIIQQVLAVPFQIGQWEYVIKNAKATMLLITYGNNVVKAQKIIIKLEMTKINVINARFINPFDQEILEQIKTEKYHQIIIFEEVMKETGLYAKLIDFFFNSKTIISHYGYDNGLIKKYPCILE